jgi:hypothetical protein
VAPDPLSVTAVPEHTGVDGETVPETVGIAFTVTVTDAVLEQPFDPVPVTV